jgi:hypothetical protein
LRLTLGLMGIALGLISAVVGLRDPGALELDPGVLAFLWRASLAGPIVSALGLWLSRRPTRQGAAVVAVGGTLTLIGPSLLSFVAALFLLTAAFFTYRAVPEGGARLP